MTSSVLYIITLTLIFSAIITNIGCSSNDSREPKTPRGSLEIGPFRVESFYNETNLKDKLRLGKSFFKLKIADKLSPDNLYLSIKLTRHEELVRCDNLTLESEKESAEFIELLDCKPLEAHLSGNEESPSSSTTRDGYIRRSSIRLRQKLPKPLPSLVNELYLYPLSKDLIDRTLNDLVEEHNLTSLDFTDLKVNLGYYFETHFKLNKEDVDPISCSGRAFLSINRTEILTRYSNDPYPEFLDEANHFLEQGSKNGYLLNLQDIKCFKTSNESFKQFLTTVTTSFTIIQRLKFPYITVRHTIGSILNLLIDYTAQVNQVLAPENGPSAYNTSVQIKSRSQLIDLLKFDLDQVFANEDFENGKETMRFILDHGALIINSVWENGSLAKIMTLSSKDPIYDSPDVAISYLIEAIKLIYLDPKESDEVDLTLKVKKRLFGSFNKLVGNLAEVIARSEEQLAPNDELGMNEEIRDEL